MNERQIARELVRVAREIMALKFNTKKELENYKKDHDVRPGTKLQVVQKKEEKDHPVSRNKVVNPSKQPLTSFKGKERREEVSSAVKVELKKMDSAITKFTGDDDEVEFDWVQDEKKGYKGWGRLSQMVENEDGNFEFRLETYGTQGSKDNEMQVRRIVFPKTTTPAAIAKRLHKELKEDIRDYIMQEYADDIDMTEEEKEEMKKS